MADNDRDESATKTSDSGLLQGNVDAYNGINVNLASEKSPHLSAEDFDRVLTASLVIWQSEKRRGIWLCIGLQQSHYVPVAAKHGFVFHHAKPQQVTMTRWLPSDEPSLLPGYAFHYIGVGGLVINSQNQMLAIQERHSGGFRRHWKLPGGLADAGEDFGVTAVREVLEETGIRAEFVSVICFRHLHKFRFGCSDIYVACLLRPLTEDIAACPHEIVNCKWMDLDEFLSDDNITATNRFIIESFKKQKEQGVSIVAQPIQAFDKKQPDNLMYSVGPLPK